MIRAVLMGCLLMAGPAAAQDVLVLGEVHDNPAHHAVEAAEVARFVPKALVFEMLTPAQAAKITADLREDPQALARVLDWQDSGWPDFSYYYNVMQATPGAVIYGAGVPRDVARRAMAEGLTAAFGPEAAAFGLDTPLPARQQKAREALQGEAHCGALPDTMLPAMVDIQRLRDASLARATLRALRDTGGPAAVITGNGHARTDWGMPALLARAQLGISVRAIGQGEDGTPPDGTFDRVIDAPAPDRGDPCAALR